MPLKFKIDDIESIDEQYRDLYKKTDDGNYQLTVEGVDNVDPIKRALEREREEKRAAKTKIDEMKSEMAALQKNIEDGKYKQTRDNGDIEALEKSWQEKLQTQTDELNQKIQAAEAALETVAIDQATSQIADIFVSKKASTPFIKSRLDVSVVDGKPVTRILDESGQPTAMTIEEFKTSLKADPDLAGIIVGSQASGGGAGDGAGGSGGIGEIDLNKASLKEKVAYMKAKQVQK